MDDVGGQLSKLPDDEDVVSPGRGATVDRSHSLQYESGQSRSGEKGSDCN